MIMDKSSPPRDAVEHTLCMQSGNDSTGGRDGTYGSMSPTA